MGVTNYLLSGMILQVRISRTRTNGRGPNEPVFSAGVGIGPPKWRQAFEGPMILRVERCRWTMSFPWVFNRLGELTPNCLGHVRAQFLISFMKKNQFGDLDGLDGAEFRTETYPTCVGLVSHFLWGEKFPFLKYTGSSQRASLELHFSIGGTAAVSNSYWYVVCFADFQGIAMQLFGTGIMKWDPFSGGDQMYGTVCELVGSFWKISPRTSALFGFCNDHCRIEVNL